MAEITNETEKPKQHELIVRHDDREVFISLLKVHLERFPEVHDTAVAQARQQIIDEMVLPLMEAADAVVRAAMMGAGTPAAERRTMHALSDTLSAVEMKMKETK